MNDVSLNPEIVELEAEMEYEMPQYPVIPNPEGEVTGYVTKLGFTTEILQVKDPEVHDWARAEEKPTYTKDEVGLGNVDNTSDMDKPVSTATQTAFNNKVDKVAGKGLSEEDFTHTLKNKLDGIEAEANKTVVDNALDGTSANPVENRVVKSALDEKLNADETAVNSNGLVIATPVTDTAPYIYRQTPVKESFKALMHKIVGASVVWNEMVDKNTFVASKTQNGLTITNNGDGTLTINGTTETNVYVDLISQIDSYHDIIEGHKYLFLSPKNPHANQYTILWGGTTLTGYKQISGNAVFPALASGSAYTIARITHPANATYTNFKYYLNMVDLTAMFGTTIADYVYTLETSQSGSGIAWLQSYGFFTEDYYAYKQNKLESGCVSAHKTYDGETLLTNTELSPITLRGLFKLSTDKLTVDGDEYNADGSVTRKYELRAYQSGDESLANAITDGTNTIVKLATPTTEQTTPFTETEIVGSTEEFIDYEVAQSNRDVAIPVGTETDYYQEMKLPSLPTTSGNHNLIYNIATGFGWS